MMFNKFFQMTAAEYERHCFIPNDCNEYLHNKNI